KPENQGRKGCDRFGGLKATEFSYPFVRSVLDVLRHLNYTTSESPKVDHKEAVWVAQIEDFFNLSLYRHQRLATEDRLPEPGPPTGGENREQLLFRCAIRSVLNDCAGRDLGLIVPTGGGEPKYVIEGRGEAIVDTGTELRTIAPLLKMT